MTRVLTVLARTWLVMLSIGLVAFPTVAAHAKPRGMRPVVRQLAPLVVVRGLGPVDASVLRLACRSLLDHYPVRCAIRATRGVFDYGPAFDHERGQLDARQTLEHVFRDRSSDALIELNVTSLDIYEHGKPFVFGLASLTDRVALISLARIDDNRARFRKRLQKLVLHEVGHALGLPHHEEHSCVMRQDATPQSLDHAPDSLCATCRIELSKQAAVLSRPGQIAYDRAVGHLARGELTEARQSFSQAVIDGAIGDGLMTAFGIAFMRAGRYDEAISILDYAIKLDARAETHASLAVALQRRGSAADLGRAIYHFERAIDLRPGWAHLATHVALLRGAPARAQGPR